MQRSNIHLVGLVPKSRDLYYGGRWQKPAGGYLETFNPASGECLGRCANANADDVDRAASAAKDAYPDWRKMRPSQRADCLRGLASVLRENKEELALIDAVNCGNPVSALMADVEIAARLIDYFAGLAYELRGSTIPVDGPAINMTVREPYGVCARIVAYNHPLMFTASRCAAPLCAGNTVIMKPPTQAPLSAYRLMELCDDLFPPGVLNVVTGDAVCGDAIVRHPDIPRITLIGSITTGRAIARAAADRLKHVTFELGGKNALVVYPDANLDAAIAGAVSGMCVPWCGQACSSTTRLFVHERVYDSIIDGVVVGLRAYNPGIPTSFDTTMGSVVSRDQLSKIERYIQNGREQGARLVCGGGRPTDPALSNGCFLEPTVFADVTMQMSIAREEIFGPVLCVIKWSDENEMFEQVNSLEFGLAAGVYTQSLDIAYRAASRFEAGYVWVNNAAKHFFPAPFGGYKQSGIGKEESFEELLSYTQEKNIYVDLGQ